MSPRTHHIKSCEHQHKGSAAHGFTMIEAMMATMVFMISIMGLVAMEKVTMSSAARAKEHTAAVNIAQFVMTRIQAEASVWPVSLQAKDNARYPFLHFVTQDNSTIAQWVRLPDDVASEVPRNLRVGEYFGHTEDNFNTQARYCVNYMLEPVGHPNPPIITDSEIYNTMVWKVRVRVAWPKEGRYIDDDGTVLWDDCHPDRWAADGLRLNNSEHIELVGYATRERASGRRR